MSVEQTTQLIQLILNSVLMSVACALVLGGLTARHAAIGQQIQHRRWEGQDSAELSSLGMVTPGRQRQSRKQRQQLRYRYQLARYSVLSAYYALLFSGLSCFILVIRGMVDWNLLIPVSLGFFVIGVATLLVAVGLTLIDWHLGDRSLLEETHKLLSFGQDAPLVPVQPRQRAMPVPAGQRRERANIRVS